MINKYSKKLPNGVYYISRLNKIYPDLQDINIMIYKKGLHGGRIYIEVRDTDNDSIPDIVVETTVIRNNAEFMKKHQPKKRLWYMLGKYNSCNVILSHWTLI